MVILYFLLLVGFLFVWWLSSQSHKKTQLVGKESILSSKSTTNPIHPPQGKDDAPTSFVDAQLVTVIIDNGEIIEEVYQRPNGQRFSKKGKRKF